MSNLTSEEKEYIKNHEIMVSNMAIHLDVVRQFKLDDILIAFYPSQPWNKSRIQLTNTYAAPKKFKVVAVDKNGVPYMKELNKKGMPTGNLISPIRWDNRGHVTSTSLTYEFEVDPDYADAIILDDVDSFNASQIHNIKAETFKEITEHNKTHKIKFNDNKLFAVWLNTLKAGDVLWRSNITFWTIIKISPVPTDGNGKIQHHNNFIEVQTNKGKILNLTFSEIKGKALYKARPRTYGELRDPK